jgi:hypothetical protein
MSVINLYLLLLSSSSLQLNFLSDLTVLFLCAYCLSLDAQEPSGILWLSADTWSPVGHSAHHTPHCQAHPPKPFLSWLTCDPAKLFIIFLSHYSPGVLHLAEGLGESGVMPRIPGYLLLPTGINIWVGLTRISTSPNWKVQWAWESPAWQLTKS